jgi:hypothetical protein
MVAQLVRQDDGSYDYVEVDTASKKTVAPDLTEFEAYEGAKKGGEELVSGPSIIKQTEKIQREIPSQVEFDAKTGTFITKKARTVDLEYKKPEITPESTELTALEKVMNMQPMAGTGDAGLEKAYASMERLQKLAEQKARAETLQSYLQTGKMVYNLASGKDYSIFTGGGINPNAYTSGAGTTPLNFLGTPVGTHGATVGTIGAAGMAGHTVSGLLGGSKKQQKTSGVGSAIGMVAGGPIGAVVGGTIGHIIGCFSSDTLVTMADNTTKPIIDIDLKDNIAIGGPVFALGKFLINDLYDYKGIKVSGTHMVNEEGIWKEVKDTKYGKSLGNNEHVVYTLGTEHRRILINNILFTDYFEVEEKDKLHEVGNEYFKNWREHVVILNKENKRILNAG